MTVATPSSTRDMMPKGGTYLAGKCLAGPPTVVDGAAEDR